MKHVLSVLEAGAVDAALRLYVEHMREVATKANAQVAGSGDLFSASADAAGRVLARLDDGFATVTVGDPS